MGANRLILGGSRVPLVPPPHDGIRNQQNMRRLCQESAVFSGLLGRRRACGGDLAHLSRDCQIGQWEKHVVNAQTGIRSDLANFSLFRPSIECGRSTWQCVAFGY